MMVAMLELSAVSKRFGSVVALDQASLRAEPGRIVGFLGPNGAGKTTAMRCIFGIVDPDEGTVRWKGRPITQADRIRFGYMPEERGLYPKMRVREQLTHFGRLSGLGGGAEAAADRWLHRLGLADRATDKVEALSHGNQQRVQLAAALVHDPVVAILDEPFSGLDPIGVESLSQVVRELADRGVAIVFSSHQLDLVEDVCEDVTIIDHGAVVLAGRLEDLRSRSTTRRLDVVVDGVAWTPHEVPVELVSGQGKPHCVIDADAPLDEILAEALRAGRLDRFSFEPPRLTDLFREAVRT